ncbi:hypothetical protein HAZT_HAZT001871 [Hyalella azteca]|uniref:DNA replication complex GINS protein PSF1 n=1 Tax=Hyalella azteca TaxID=294128 RepID=A0A6A0HCP1_HYAAZ|nr:hypothetical protein HAZT_HAZT001871 [Hyalella azteca]
MLGDKAFSLIQELDRSQHGTLPPFNEDAVRQALEEIDSLFQQNVADINHLAEDDALVAGIHLRHAALERNKRCLLAYFLSLLKIRYPEDSPLEWFAQYSSTVARYMRSLGDGQGLDLTVDLKPPKNLYIEVTT